MRSDIAGLAGGEVIYNSGSGDLLDLTESVVVPELLTIGPDGLLAIPDVLGTLTMLFSDAAGSVVTLAGDGGSGTDIWLANALCFCAGTRIRTA